MYAVSLGVMEEGGPSYASQCIKCGKCEKHCPQELPIMELLDDVSDDMEGIITKLAPPIFKTFLTFQRFRIGRKAKNL